MAVTNGWGQGVINNTNGWGKLATNSIDAGAVYQDSASGDTALIGTSAAFSYSASSYTQADADPTPTITGTTGGTFSGTSGLVFVSTSTGEIDLSASTIAAHVVTYTVGGVSSNFNLSVTAAPFASTKSIAFDGVDDKISLGSSIDLGLNSTISLWVKRDSTSGQVFLGEVSYNSNYLLYVTTTLFFRIGNNAKNFAGATVEGIMNDTTNWINIIFVRSGDSVELFLNGSSMGSMTGLGTTVTTKIDTIGDRPTGSFPSTGNFDEIAFWDSALTSANVTSIYNSGVPNNLDDLTTPPTAWYRMGENGSWKYPQWLLPEDSNKDKISNFSFEFDGVGDNIDLGTSILDGLGALSISFWFNTSYDGWQYFLGDNSFRINMNQAGDDVRLRFNNSLDYKADPLPVTLNTWNNIVVVFDGSLTQANRLKLYLNGSLATNILSGTADTTFVASNNFRLGRVGSFSGQQFVGMMDDVAFFNTALTSGNVTSIYNSGTPTTLPVTPVAHYKMGEEATFTDNWLVNNSALSNYSTRSFGNFSTGDYIQFGDIPLTGAFCISAWLNLNAVTNETILGDSSNLDWLRIDNANDLKIKINGSTTTISNTGAFSSGSWFHLAVVRDSSDVITVYKNGAALSTTATASGTFTPERIGFKTPTPSNYDGFIDEVAIWDSELTSANITTIYNSGEPDDISSLSPLSWWRMGEDASFNGTDFTLPDNGSASNTGTSSGMVLNDLTGEAPNYTGGGLSANMTIEDRVGEAPNSSNNSLSYNMDEVDRETDVPS